jgi:hypothetical protein
VSAQEFKAEIFDVILCHNREDRPAVREIAQRLKKAGVKPWLVEDQIRPGTLWQTALGEQIENIKSVAVFVGKNGIGSWQDEEIQAFIAEFVDRGCPVIPTVLADVTQTPKLPWTLRNRHCVDFRETYPEPLKQLVWAITGRNPAEAGKVALIAALNSDVGTFATYAHPGVYARAVIPVDLCKIPYAVWASNGDPFSPAQWKHTLFASTDNQVQLVIDTRANSIGETIKAFFNAELVKRAVGGRSYQQLGFESRLVRDFGHQQPRVQVLQKVLRPSEGKYCDGLPRLYAKILGCFQLRLSLRPT